MQSDQLRSILDDAKLHGRRNNTTLAAALEITLDILEQISPSILSSTQNADIHQARLVLNRWKRARARAEMEQKA